MNAYYLIQNAWFRRIAIAACCVTGVLVAPVTARPTMEGILSGARSFEDGEVGAYEYRLDGNDVEYLIMQKGVSPVNLPMAGYPTGEVEYKCPDLEPIIISGRKWIVVEKTTDGFCMAKIKLTKRMLEVYLASGGQKFTIAELRDFAAKYQEPKK